MIWKRAFVKDTFNKARNREGRIATTEFHDRTFIFLVADCDVYLSVIWKRAFVKDTFNKARNREGRIATTEFHDRTFIFLVADCDVYICWQDFPASC